MSIETVNSLRSGQRTKYNELYSHTQAVPTDPCDGFGQEGLASPLNFGVGKDLGHVVQNTCLSNIMSLRQGKQITIEIARSAANNRSDRKQNFQVQGVQVPRQPSPQFTQHDQNQMPGDYHDPLSATTVLARVDSTIAERGHLRASTNSK